MQGNLKGKKVAILATDGFELVELTEPKKALEEAGASTQVIALKSGKIQGFNHDKPGDTVKVDKTVDEVKASDYDALILPGGVINPDNLRTNTKAVSFVREFAES